MKRSSEPSSPRLVGGLEWVRSPFVIVQNILVKVDVSGWGLWDQLAPQLWRQSLWNDGFEKFIYCRIYRRCFFYVRCGLCSSPIWLLDVKIDDSWEEVRYEGGPLRVPLLIASLTCALICLTCVLMAWPSQLQWLLNLQFKALTQGRCVVPFCPFLWCFLTILFNWLFVCTCSHLSIVKCVSDLWSSCCHVWQNSLTRSTPREHDFVFQATDFVRLLRRLQTEAMESSFSITISRPWVVQEWAPFCGVHGRWPCS